MGPHAPYTVSDDSFIALKKQAIASNQRVHLHLHETRAEVEDSERGVEVFIIPMNNTTKYSVPC
jgi:cytosine/adenosine deaminase-related metal-dependent hydrolase